MNVQDTRRRLFWHGILLFMLGLLSGVFVQTMTNPRMGLAAHTSGVASGTFLAVLGSIWSELRLGPRAEAAAYWLAVYATYAGWAAVQLAAILGTSRMTPIAGAGYSAPAYQEAIVSFGLGTGAAALLLACVLLLRGLRGPAAAWS
jgi:hydroxylaminobenzene mutase